MDAIAVERGWNQPQTRVASLSSLARLSSEENQSVSPAATLAAAEAPIGANGMPLDHAFGENSAPAPNQAGLLTDFLPIDRVSLESAIDHFLENFEVLGGGMPDLQFVEGLTLPLVAGLVVFVAADAVVRRRRSQRGRIEESGMDGAPIVHPLLRMLA
jgi:hypothetical protein